MRVLWITNTIFPRPGQELGLPATYEGGWMISLEDQMKSSKEIVLSVASIYPGSDLKSINADGVIYYLLPVETKTSYNKNLEQYWKKICSDFKPDIIHIHGTEYSHGLACMIACPEMNYVISLQGIINAITRYLSGGITQREILINITVRDILRGDTLFHQKKQYLRRSILEKEYFMRTRHVIGRTTWDYCHSKVLHPLVNYHFCNESLRDLFYNSPKWDINKIARYSVFISQGCFPIKGLHQVLKAVCILRSDFPELKIRVAGPDILHKEGRFGRFKINGYGAYIKRLIKKEHLADYIEFTGILKVKDMVNEYLTSHIFICPSSIENSSNSVGEAQILGVPCIGTFAGGIPDMITHGESGLLYRFEEFEMLAESIKSVFNDTNLAKRLSEGGLAAANKRHDIRNNYETMISIYRKVLNQESLVESKNK